MHLRWVFQYKRNSMKMVKLALMAVVVAWLSWLWRYDVQVIPVTVAELYSANDQNWMIDKAGHAYAFDAQTGLVKPITNSVGLNFEAFIPKTPAIVWRWDRWTATGTVETFAEIDASGKVTLLPNK